MSENDDLGECVRSHTEDADGDEYPPAPADVLPLPRWLNLAKIGRTTYAELYRDDLRARRRIWEDPTGMHWIPESEAHRVRRERLKAPKSGRAGRGRRSCARCGADIPSLRRACPACGA